MSFIIVSVLVAWLVNQGLKMAIMRKPRSFWECGGMPSSHAAFASALYAAFGLDQGFAAPVSLLALAVGIYIAHDVTRIRKAHNFTQTIVGLIVGCAVVLALKYLVY